MRYDHDFSSGIFLFWTVAIMVAVCIWGAFIFNPALGSSDASDSLQTRGESPLDAIAYDAPTFTRTSYGSYRVTDRFSHQSWWVVRMGGDWIVLPISGTEVSMG